jgi:hypothetical protein
MPMASKICPLAAAHPQQENSDCLGEACACYLKIHKHRLMQTDGGRFVDPDYFYRYTGCGLVAQIPWDLVKREDKQNSSA